MIAWWPNVVCIIKAFIWFANYSHKMLPSKARNNANLDQTRYRGILIPFLIHGFGVCVIGTSVCYIVNYMYTFCDMHI